MERSPVATRNSQLKSERVRWERIQTLLDALEAVPAAEHAAYLARACPDEGPLREEVLALLTVESEAGAYLDGFARELAPSSADLSGRRIGAYRLLRPLGRGGMGVVYEAERADGAFEQRVALKLLTTALAGTEARARFLAERRILAGLEHAAIARILDGGVSDDGTPWFAMEHVEGEPIDLYCDCRRLGIRARLELFLQVCDAVEHAHQRLVVHRDLKPGNVLVTEAVVVDRSDASVQRATTERRREALWPTRGGTTPRVKLLDFGIAKLLDGEGDAESVPLTRTALRLMTPEYASPEQVRGDPVTTASDVYQLGLLLYELLTGYRPYTLRHRRVSELENAICEQIPSRLSTVVTRGDTLRSATASSAATVEEVCRTRRSSPARLRRRLRGDLDNIVLKALSKEPESRYRSADRLAQDIRRHLDGLPVTARSGTALYRARKLLARHAVGATLTVLALLLAVGMTAFHTSRVQSERDRAQQERDRAEAERDRAQTEAAKASQMSQFLTGLFRGADPREARGAELTARELLDRGVQQVDRELTGQPEIQADMLQVLGHTYLELDLHEPAERLLTRALDLRRSRLGLAHPDVADSLREVGLLRHRQGEYEEARELLREAGRILTAAPEGHELVLAEVLSTRGMNHWILGEQDESRTALEGALAIRSRVAGETSPLVAEVLVRLAVLFTEMGDYERAENHFERALAIHERELGGDHPIVGSTLANLAHVRSMLGKDEGVEALHRRGLAIHEKAYGSEHSNVGKVLNNLGHYLTSSGRIDEAVAVLQRALEVHAAALGSEHHPELAYPLASLGDAHLAGDRLSEARRYYQRSVALREPLRGLRQFDPVLFHGLVGLGRIEARLGDGAASDELLTRALDIWQSAPPAVDPQLADAILHLGAWLTEQHRCAEAAPLLDLATRLPTNRPDHPATRLQDLELLLAACPP